MLLIARSILAISNEGKVGVGLLDDVVGDLFFDFLVGAGCVAAGANCPPPDTVIVTSRVNT